LSTDTGGGVKVLSEKTGLDDNFQNERSDSESILIIPAISGAQELQIRFYSIIRFRFRFLTADDGFPNFPCLNKKAVYG